MLAIELLENDIEKEDDKFVNNIINYLENIKIILNEK